MEYRRFDNTIVARIDRGEEVLEQVAAIAQAEQIKLASVQALGAVGGVYGRCVPHGRKAVPRELLRGRF